MENGSARKRLLLTLCAIILASMLVVSCSRYHAFMLSPRVTKAERDFNSSYCAISVLEYDRLYNIHPDPKMKAYFLFQKGQCLYIMNDYTDARKVFEEYQQEFPDGEHKTEVHALLTKIAALRASQEELEAFKIEEAMGNVEQIEDLLTTQPFNAHLHYELANAYWRLEKYDKAAKAYLTATEIDAAYKENDLIKRRLMYNDKGEIVPMTPELQDALERERNPLVIFDVNDYTMRGERDLYSARQNTYIVAGKVRNQSERPQRNVIVEVTFYNISREILDVRTYRVGTMGPKEVRAFVVQSTFADDIYNIYSFDCRAYYD